MYWREGEIAPNFDFEQVEPQLVSKVVATIEEFAATRKPFFIYFASPAPHTPVIPTGAFRGTSDAGRYGDFVRQTDASFGRIHSALKAAGVADKTLIILTSDNGAVNYTMLEAFDHAPNGSLRGQKSELYEGGHRVPFIVGWAENGQSGISDRLTVQTDIFATLADITGSDLLPDQAPDSFSFADTLGFDLQTDTKRPHAVHHSLYGTFAYRRGPWKLVLDDQGGGYGAQYPDLLQGVLEGRFLEPERSTYRLFNIAEDPGERIDLASENLDLVDELAAELEALRSQGFTRPGAAPLGQQ